jgi:uncharacterized protein
MTSFVTLLVGLAMAVGIVGTVVPFLPGLGLVVVAAVMYGFVVGWDAVGFVSLGVILVLGAAGAAARIFLADRSSTRGGAPRRSLLIASVAAVVGFFVIPVVGLLVGAAAGLVVAEYQRTHSWSAAWRSSQVTIVGFSTGVLVEMAAGVLMALVWLAWVLV